MLKDLWCILYTAEKRRNVSDIPDFQWQLLQYFRGTNELVGFGSLHLQKSFTQSKCLKNENSFRRYNGIVHDDNTIFRKLLGGLIIILVLNNIICAYGTKVHTCVPSYAIVIHLKIIVNGKIKMHPIYIQQQLTDINVSEHFHHFHLILYAI